MIRKLFVFIILVSMALHCASRLEVLHFVYKKRNQIAFSIGLIAEIPISMCNSEYDFERGLKIDTAQEDSDVPIGLVQANEINLFLVSHLNQLIKELYIISSNGYPSVDISHKDRYLHTVFHPPAQES